MSKDLKLPEISEKDFRCLADTDDLIRRYGNPVIIRSEEKHDLVCMAREYYERMVQERNQMRREENIRYWIYEFSMPLETKQKLDRICASYEMTMDEFFQSAVAAAIRRAETDPEGLRREWEEIEAGSESGMEIQLVRCYPVYQGETEAQALNRKLAEETEQESDDPGIGQGRACHPEECMGTINEQKEEK